MSSSNKTTTKMISASSLEPWTLARLHGVVQGNVYAFEHGKHDVHRPHLLRPTPLRVKLLNERATLIFNACINAWTARHYEEFGEDHLGEMVLCPNVSTQAVVQPSEFSASEFPSVPSECYDDDEFSGSEFPSVPSECYDDEFSSSAFTVHESISDLQSYEYFKEGTHTEVSIIGEDATHAEFPDEETMAVAFEGDELPTQNGFNMIPPEDDFADDFGDVAELSPEDAEALAEVFADQLNEDSQFSRDLTAIIHAVGLFHAINETTPTTEEFFALYARHPSTQR
jgi:hypothetical protein